MESTDDLNPALTHNYIINIGGSNPVSYFARSVTLPGWDVAAIDTPFNTHRMAMPSNSRTRDVLVVEMILSEKLSNYKEIRKWGKTALRGAGDITECMKDVTVVMLDSNKKPIDDIKYNGCYPCTISNLTLESGIVDTMPQTFTVTFMYEEEDWE